VIDPDEVERYRPELAEAYETIPLDHIVNADESFWLILYLPQKTIALTGTETVKAEIDGDPKAGMTIMGIITALGLSSPCSLSRKGSLLTVTNNLATSLVDSQLMLSIRPVAG
jgi:hypothetical protein